MAESPAAPAPAPSDEFLVALYATRTLALVDLLIDVPISRAVYQALQRHLDEAGPALDAWERLHQPQRLSAPTLHLVGETG